MWTLYFFRRMQVQWYLNQGLLVSHVEALFPEQPLKYDAGVFQVL